MDPGLSHLPCPSGASCPSKKDCWFDHPKEPLTDKKQKKVKESQKKRRLEHANHRESPEKRQKQVASGDAHRFNHEKEVHRTLTAKTAEKRNIQVHSITDLSKPPQIQASVVQKIPHLERQHLLEKFYHEYVRIYRDLLQEYPKLAHEHAIEQEKELHDNHDRNSYKRVAGAILGRLRKRTTCNNIEEAQIDGKKPKPKEDRIPFNHEILTKQNVSKCIRSEQVLQDLGYFVNVDLSPLPPIDEPDGTQKKCERCPVRYQLISELSDKDKEACWYHPMRPRTETAQGEKGRKHACCGKTEEQPCETGPHIFKEELYQQLHARIPFVEIPENSNALDVVALDAEMVFTTGGFELARLSMCNHRGETLLDSLVQPTKPIVDFNSRWSGITSLDGAISFHEARQRLFEFVGKDTILIGHGLENDLKVLRLVHTKIVDTAALFPHPRGLPMRNSLRFLASKYLGRFIQESTSGHDPLEDSKSALELVAWYLNKYPEGEGDPWLKPSATQEPLSKMLVGPMMKSMK